jgi:hypothetical protein
MEYCHHPPKVVIEILPSPTEQVNGLESSNIIAKLPLP